MIEFLAPRDDAPELTVSPILRAALLTLDYLQVNGPIGLTPAKPLKRYFVTWAAQVFDWPHYTAQLVRPFSVSRKLTCGTIICFDRWSTSMS
ncbi:hypothetical protein [Novosphingobium mathurense]|uniref:Uncharacterized protein n=1 Tax=Novosphingobium mathurense TaxID=428990 RepID=A0A1U6IXB1_9SPHN|nr:hypothetical protein [Novosphingobium mathurense]SLK12659.1 hypothetical protein SAMN06295987_1215 [Novosphingobium mathurense]